MFSCICIALGSGKYFPAKKMMWKKAGFYVIIMAILKK